MGLKIKNWMFPAACAVVISAAAVSAQVDTAYVPLVVVNTDAVVKVYNHSVLMLHKNVTKNLETTLAVPLSVAAGGAVTGVQSAAQRRLNAPAVVSGRDGKIALSLSPQSYKNAEVSLYTVNGKRVMHGQAAATEAAADISRRDLTAGVYLLSVKGTDGSVFASRVTHRGGSLSISAAFLSGPDRALAKESATAAAEWSVTASASGYIDSAYAFSPVKGRNNAKHNITLKQPKSTVKADFRDTVGNVSFDMIYIPGSTFTLGCEKSSGCPSDTKPVENVKVSNYYIGKAEVTNGLWKAVMGSAVPPPSYAQNSGSATHITWYDALDFACKLSQMTGRRYRMMTEAEFEFAAKKYADKLSNLGGGSGVGGEEWAYNSWSSTHMGGTDPVGPGSGTHTQKTRRDANGTGDNITGRLIRSIEGIGPALRLAVSADTDYPPGMVPTCDIHAPEMGDEPENSYRDMRWVTGDDYEWGGGFADYIIKVWEDGAAVMGMVYNKQLMTTAGLGASGEWYTVNNFAFKIATGTSPKDTVRPKLAYIFVDNDHVSLIADNGISIGRFERRPTTITVKKPTVPGTALSVLASASEDKMIDMTNIPASAKQQDSRLLDGGATKGWFQNNTAAGGVHHYRKDVDLDEFRFTVNQNNGRTMLANGSWFTVSNTFLRVTHSTGYTCDYLYTVTTDKDGKRSFYHNSFMGYERGDFRVFVIETNGSAWPKTTCGDICSEEIPKGLSASMYSSQGATGKSTYKPAPCPAGGCK
ncbi:hypothetical protein R80B4_01221 [Fibrobacteres bacterium R8-0-B4]